MANPVFTVTRNDNGTASYSYDGDTTDNVAAITASGYWDDATPWASGSYNLLFHVKTNTGKDSFRLDPVDGRTGILIHTGDATNDSEGCLIVAQSFIDSVYADLEGRGVDTDPTKATGVDFSVSGDFDVRLALTATTTSVDEGNAMSLTVSLVGAGATNGLSKPLYVQLGVAGGSATEGNDYQALLSNPNQVAINGSPGWFAIPAGETSITITIPTVLDNVDAGTESPSEIANFAITNYRVVNDYVNSADKYYLDGAQILTRDADVEEAITIVNKSSVVDKTINASGGFEGYHVPEQFSPGQTIAIHFEPYSIPDRFSLTASDGTTLLDTGFIGNGTIYDTTFKIPSTGDGAVTINVDTNNTGTAWTFTVSTVKAALASGLALAGMDASATLFSAKLAAPLVAAGSVSVLQNGPEFLEGDTSSVGPSFELKLLDEALRGTTINWAVDTSGNVTSADFPTGAVLSGSIVVPGDAAAGASLSFIELNSPIDDDVAEGNETFVVRFTDAGGQALLDGSGNPVTATFQIVDEYVVAPVQQGTPGDDTIAGAVVGAVINALTGNDTITGTAGNDYIDAGAGNDLVSAGGGDDRIIAGFGDDTIDGGTGFDTLLLPRLMADIVITKNPDGSVTVTDTSSTSQGTDTLRGVESLVLADGTIAIDSTVTPPPSAGGKVFLFEEMPQSDAERLASADKLIFLDATASNLTVTNRAATGLSFESIALSADGITRTFNASVLHDVAQAGNLVFVSGDEMALSGSAGDVLSLSQGLTGRGGIAYGFGGDDAISGGNADDTILGGDGDDVINGVSSTDLEADYLFGGNGNDIINGSLTNDHIYGNAAGSPQGAPDGRDTINAGDGGDYVNGNMGDDVIDGGAGDDRLFGGAGNDRLLGSDGNDSINGNLGNDIIDGGADNDTLRGGQGNDSIVGGIGNDQLLGDLGQDTLIGGAGYDAMSGGGGADRFVFGAGDADILELIKPGSAETVDAIIDLGATDRIQLAHVPAAVLYQQAGVEFTSALAAYTYAQELLDTTATTSDVALIQVGADAYLFGNALGIGAEIDMAIKLTGIDATSVTVQAFV
jgi:Ca2+-binding RTX toxin-like protein